MIGDAARGLAAFRNLHRDAPVLVCGCGESLNALGAGTPAVTIGVNDVGRLFDPTYLVVVNPRSQFTAERFRHVERSRAAVLFTQLDLGNVDPPVVRFQLGRYGGTELDGDVLHYTQNSPYVAVCLAAYMGARRIGLLGVDLTDHHFFGPTGRHPLAGRLAQIDREYGALAAALGRRGVELVNLSPISQLRSLPRASLEAFAAGGGSPGPAPRPRVFVVNYRFLSCGDVFADGLRHAAAERGVEHAEAVWDDPRLPEKVVAFHPDLVLVVHGRRFAQRWGDRFHHYRTAVWLTDEPYEVDDTAAWSGRFDWVFANDAATLERHRHAHYLPVCYDPRVHRPGGEARRYTVGFIGGGNPARERALSALERAGLLGYVVGGPWRLPALRARSLAANVPPARTAELYRQTEIVVNVFRETHHYNARGTAATAMNPRIYEALACGAAVVSERRPEIAGVCPDLPQFDTPGELVAIVQALLADRERLDDVRRRSAARLAGHTYGDRLSRVVAVALGAGGHAERAPGAAANGTAQAAASAAAPAVPAARAAPVPPLPPHRLASSAARPGEPACPSLASPPRPGDAPVTPIAFGATPRRHLLYHVWPVRGTTWRWNLEQLARRIDLFNGGRVIGVVCDERSEPAEAVQEMLEGHGCEFVVARNDPRGEAATFPSLLARVASTGTDEVSFYAHAKGVKYEPAFPPAVRRWAEVQYGVMLDDWRRVKAQLEAHAMTGAFRKHGRFRNHGSVGDWHYSGTFFWMRHAHVFRRRWAEVPQFYGGVEAWPGLHFGREETGFLLLDDVRELPYQGRFWSQRGDPAFRQWQAAARPVPVPADLATPAPFEGHTWPRLEQKPAEFARFLERLLQHRVERVLSIGGGHGGVEWHVARAFHAHGRAVEITAVAPRESAELAAAFDDARRRFGARIHVVTGPAARSRLPARCDAVFIDGDHGYRACRADFELALALEPALIGLHDIVDSDWHAANRCCVSRLWAEIAGAHAIEAVVDGGEWGGIGLVTRPGR
jgi:hypothetical protein